MTKHIPNKQRRLEWEVEELQRLEEKNKLLRVIYDEAAEALNASDDDVLRHQTIVKLMRGGDLTGYDSALERQEWLGADNIKVWGPYGNPLIPVEPLVGQPGALERNKTLLPDNTPYGDVPVHGQVGEADVAFPASKIAVEGGTDSGGTLPITRQEAIDRAIDVMHTAEAKRDESAIPPDNAPNGGDWKAYHEEQRRLAEETAGMGVDVSLNIGVGTAINPDAVSRSFHVNAAGNELPECASTCTTSRHYFSNANGLPIGTPCFCGARQWGVDPAKEGAKP